MHTNRRLTTQITPNTIAYFQKAIITIFALIVVPLLLFLPKAALAINCSFQSATGVNFGSYDVFAVTPNDSSGSITYRCRAVKGAPIRITLNRGSSISYNPRTMRKPTNEFLEYNVFLDAARTNIWGDGTNGTSFYQIVPPGNANVTIPIYGRIRPDQDISAGVYTDTIVATLIW